MRLHVAIAALLALVALAACGGEEPKTALSYTADAKRAYDAAMQEYDAHNWLEAQTLMREVKRKYGYSKYARLAELRIADADFEQEKFADAIREYKEFVRAHRSDAEDVAYARGRIAEATYSEIPESFLLPAGEERDQATVLDAYKELRGYLADYPASDKSDRVRELLADVAAKLVRHELYVARFYLAKDNYEAAIARIQYAMRNFTASIGGPHGQVMPDSGLEAEALLLLGQVYLQQHKWSEARAAFETIVTRYTTSPLILQARNYLEYMRGLGV